MTNLKSSFNFVVATDDLVAANRGARASEPMFRLTSKPAQCFVTRSACERYGLKDGTYAVEYDRMGRAIRLTHMSQPGKNQKGLVTAHAVTIAGKPAGLRISGIPQLVRTIWGRWGQPIRVAPQSPKMGQIIVVLPQFGAQAQEPEPEPEEEV